MTDWTGTALRAQGWYWGATLAGLLVLQDGGPVARLACQAAGFGGAAWVIGRAARGRVRPWGWLAGVAGFVTLPVLLLAVVDAVTGAILMDTGRLVAGAARRAAGSWLLNAALVAAGAALVRGATSAGRSSPTGIPSRTP